MCCAFKYAGIKILFLEFFYMTLCLLNVFLTNLGLKIILRQDFMDVLRVGIRSGELNKINLLLCAINDNEKSGVAG